MTDEDATSEAFEFPLFPELRSRRDRAMEARWEAWVGRWRDVVGHDAIARAQPLVDMAFFHGLGDLHAHRTRFRAELRKRQSWLDDLVRWMREGHRLLGITPGRLGPDYVPMLAPFAQHLVAIEDVIPIARAALARDGGEDPRSWTPATFARRASAAITPAGRRRDGQLLALGELVEVVFPAGKKPKPRARIRVGALVNPEDDETDEPRKKYEAALRKRTQKLLAANQTEKKSVSRRTKKRLGAKRPK